MTTTHPNMQDSTDGALRVLLVDDDADVTQVLSHMLQGMNCQVRGCSSAEDGLMAFGQDPADFDLVLTDYNLPGISGLEMARRLRRVRGDLPVVLCTGYCTAETEDEARGMGVEGILSKPFGLQALARVLDRFRPPNTAPSERIA